MRLVDNSRDVRYIIVFLVNNSLVLDDQISTKDFAGELFLTFS